MYRYIIVIILTVFSFYESLAQTPQMKKISDSLAVKIIQCTDTTEKLKIYSNLIAYNSDKENLNYFIISCENLVRNREDSTILLVCYANYIYSSLCSSIQDYPQIENIIQKGLKISRKLNNKKIIAYLFYYQAMCCDAQNNITGMLDYANIALENHQASKDTAGILTIDLMFGQVFGKINMYQKAYEHLFKAEMLAQEHQQPKTVATCNGIIGSTIYKQFQNETNDTIRASKLKTAIYFSNLALKELLKDKNNQLDEIAVVDICYTTKAQCFIKLAKIYNNKSYSDSCNIYLNKINGGLIDIDILKNIAEAEYLNYKKQYTKSLEILKTTEPEVDSSSTLHLSQLYYLMSESYNGLKKYSQASEYINKADYYESLNMKENTQKQYAEFKAKTIYERKIQLMEVDKIIEEIRRQNEIKTQQMWFYLIIIFIILTIILILGITHIAKNYRKNYKEYLSRNKELNILNQKIIKKKSEIESQHDEILMQKDIVDSINESITSSIKYAYKIQSSIMPKFTDIQKYFSECFVIFRPRDIVSGDFYLVAQKGDYKIVIIADCTGHGVPGGLLSMLGISAINDILRQTKYDDNFCPGLIIDQLREFIISTFTNKDKDYLICDGMDMTICAINTNKMIMKLASANQNTYIWTNKEVIRLKGDKMPVGRYIIENKHFTTQEINLEKNSMVYLLTDGIQDQLGGEFNHKFLITNIIELIKENGHKTAEEQFYIVNETIDNWKKDKIQIDDMTMIGIRV